MKARWERITAFLIASIAVSSCATYRAVGAREYQAARALEGVSLADVSQAMVGAMKKNSDMLQRVQELNVSSSQLSPAMLAEVAADSQKALTLNAQASMSSLAEGKEKAQLFADMLLESSRSSPENYLFYAFYRKKMASEGYTQPSHAGLLPAIVSSFEDTRPVAMRVDAKEASASDGFFDKLLEQLKANSGINLATIVNGGDFVEVATTDVLRLGKQGEMLSPLEAMQFQVTAGSVVVDEDGEGDAGFAGSVGIATPVGGSGSIGLGYGTYRDGNRWESGLFVSLNIAGARPTANN